MTPETIHYLERCEERRVRLRVAYASSQALCSTGEAHQHQTRNKRAVTCPQCRALLRSK